MLPSSHNHDQANDRSLDADIQLVERGISLLRRQLDTARRDQLVLRSLRDRAARDTQGFVDDLVAGRLALPQPQQVFHIPSLEWILAQPRSDGDSELGHASIPYHQPTSLDPLPPVTATRVLPPLSLTDPISSGPSWAVGASSSARPPDPQSVFPATGTPTQQPASRPAAAPPPPPPTLTTNPLANPLEIVLNPDAYSAHDRSRYLQRDRESMHRLIVREKGGAGAVDADEEPLVDDATKLLTRLSGAQYASVPLDSMDELISRNSKQPETAAGSSAASSRSATPVPAQSGAAHGATSAPPLPPIVSHQQPGAPLRYPNKRRKTAASDFNYEVFTKSRAAAQPPPPPDPPSAPIAQPDSVQPPPPAPRARPKTAPPSAQTASTSQPKQPAARPAKPAAAASPKRAQPQPRRAPSPRPGGGSIGHGFIGSISDEISSPQKPKSKSKSAAAVKPKKAASVSVVAKEAESVNSNGNGKGSRGKRGPGRPAKQAPSANGKSAPEDPPPPPKRGPGRPRKSQPAPARKRSQVIDDNDDDDADFLGAAATHPADGDDEDDSILEIDDGVDPALAAYLSGTTTHAESQCARCRACPIIGDRYACRDCIDPWNTDLCERCYGKRGEFENEYHSSNHRFRKVTIVPDL